MGDSPKERSKNAGSKIMSNVINFRKEGLRKLHASPKCVLICKGPVARSCTPEDEALQLQAVFYADGRNEVAKDK
jgi:hypothetical protein